MKTFRYVAFCLLISFMAIGQSQNYQQAPSLAELVDAGQLPPVGERLPENPVVIEPIENIGFYGGTWTVIGSRSEEAINRHIGYENLLRWNEDGSEFIPNLAESWEVNEDGTEYVFNLRRGVRWSDGTPFTADDILFWYEDLAGNDSFNPGGNKGWYDGGIPNYFRVSYQGEVVDGSLEKLDDYSIRMTFPEGNGLLLRNLASVWGMTFTRYPKHYLMQFHPDYNPDVQTLVAEAGFDDWVQLMVNRMNWWNNAEVPTLNAWQLEVGYNNSTTQLTAVRNPYYFKVDPEGNQLPYIDRFVYNIVAEPEVRLLQLLNGEANFSFQGGELALENKALYLDNLERGNFRLFDVVPSQLNTLVIALNLTHPDPAKREMFQNLDFRRALSHAINREEIIDLIYLGQGQPFQPAPLPDTLYADETLSGQYLDYDVTLANEYLDAAGYLSRDAQGYRLGPDGQRIRFGIEVRTDLAQLIDALELIQGYWRDIGIDMQIQALDSSLMGERLNANLFDARAFNGTEGTNMLILDPFYFLPFRVAANIHFAVLWSNWYSGVTPNEEPPERIRQQLALYDELKASPDAQRQDALMREILEITAEEFYTIGVSLPPMNFGIASTNLRNIPDSMLSSWLYLTPGPVNPAQFYFATDN